MGAISLDERSSHQKVSTGECVTVPFLNSCCLVIVWFGNGDVYAQHCQNGTYSKTCKISTEDIIQAVYITAKTDDQMMQDIVELNNMLRPKIGIYYFHKEKNSVTPLVGILDNCKYTLYNIEDYDSITLSSNQELK